MYLLMRKYIPQANDNIRQEDECLEERTGAFYISIDDSHDAYTTCLIPYTAVLQVVTVSTNSSSSFYS